MLSRHLNGIWLIEYLVCMRIKSQPQKTHKKMLWKQKQKIRRFPESLCTPCTLFLRLQCCQRIFVFRVFFFFFVWFWIALNILFFFSVFNRFNPHTLHINANYFCFPIFSEKSFSSRTTLMVILLVREISISNSFFMFPRCMRVHV